MTCKRRGINLWFGIWIRIMTESTFRTREAFTHFPWSSNGATRDATNWKQLLCVNAGALTASQYH